MSVKLVAEEVRRFLKSSEPETICIMGKWGVGKTHAWNEFLSIGANENSIALKRYSYVSLFGQNSLEGLKYSIFENTIKVSEIKAGPDLGTFTTNINALRKNARRVFGLATFLPQTKDYLPALAQGFFLTIRNQIICIDDLERVGEGLSTKDVLGLISFLRNERKCKVVVLLNNEELTADAAKHFESQLEKVVDVEIRFEPTAEEAAKIAVDTSTSFHLKLAQTCMSLGIVNIRVIRKIQRMAERLQELLSSHDKRIFDSAFPSMILFGWVIYQPKLAPSLEYVKDYFRFGDLLDKKKTETEDEKKWRVLLSSIEYTNFDEFDALVLESLQRGYFDSDAIDKAAKALDKKFQLQDQDNSFSAAWDKFRGSFSCDEKEVLDEMFEAFKKGVQSISPMNMDGTVSLFRRFGRDTQAEEMISYYMKERDEKRDFYDSSRSVFLELKDPGAKKAFSDKLASFHDTRTPEEILMQIARASGWNPQDITTLAEISADQYYALFKETTGDDLRIIVSQALKFRQFAGADKGMLAISEHAEEALKRIAKECRINRERVEAYGVTPDEPQEDKKDQ